MLDEIVKPKGQPIPVAELARIKQSEIDGQTVDIVSLLRADLALLDKAAPNIRVFVNAKEA